MHKKIASLAILATCVMGATVASAQVTTTSPGVETNATLTPTLRGPADAPRGAQAKETQAGIREQKQADMAASKEEKCKNTEQRVANRIQRFQNDQNMIETTQSNMKARLDRLTARLKSAGADTAKLESDLVFLYSKMEKVKADNATFIASLQGTQTATCTLADGDFKTKMGEARKQNDLVRQDRLDVKSFFEKTIKADLLAIRTQLQKIKTETEITKPEAGFNSPNPALQNPVPPINSEYTAN
jgi:hypothetical protein